MTALNVTVYSCLLNEANSIRGLMDSLLAQTYSPSEILVVDGGSSDGTPEIVKRYAERDPRVRLVSAPGSNIAQARNVAFRESRGTLIASIDGACVARPDWLERLLAQVGPGVDIVSGMYVADPHSDWDQVMEEFFYPEILKLPDDWKEPSHSSVLVRREVWDRVGPIPEHLYRSEDSWFNSAASALGFRFRTARDALVYRRPRQSFREVFRNTSIWVQSDIENGVNMPRQLQRAARIAFRLDAKLFGLATWIAASALSIVAGALTFPVLFASLVKISHRMESVRHFMLFNAVDYVVMAASALGLARGCMGIALGRSSRLIPR